MASTTHEPTSCCVVKKEPLLVKPSEPISTSFCVMRKDPLLVKPSAPIPRHDLFLSTIDNYTALENFTHTLYVYRPIAVAPPNSNCPDPVSVLKQSLARTVVFYYPLAGKIMRYDPDRSLRITFNSDEEDIGVPFLEAAVLDCDLSSLNYMDGEITSVAKEFIFYNQPPINKDDQEPYHPLRLQVTVFPCGGFIIGMSILHSIVDVFGAAQFFKALAELAGGKVEPSVIPVWERERLIVNIMPDEEKAVCNNNNNNSQPNNLPESQHLSSELINECVDISSDGIKRLKLKLATELGDNVTTFEALSSYIWRSRFKALEFNPDDKTVFVMMVGLRDRLDHPKLPKGYYGNSFILSSPIFVIGRDLVEGPLSKMVKLIKETKNICSQPEFIRRSLSSSERTRSENIGTILKSRGGVMFATDWRSAGIREEENFGWGGCVNIVPVPYNMIGNNNLCVLLPPLRLDNSNKDGVKVFIGLPKVAMDKFKQEIHALHQ
ncbi:spermidine sinapoyl-CoA acyltransferase-like [Impatiens glandulifera]|uniref:spermidine sinapoyl-CoA acyltransferase-like n=1 Tax=Impatiens glandulifera TaxID=253017 RepID=UPI001FB14625|nr:spermidine sinapoyl-CoA acyltransferase-like [Impatiens glandulifera]